VITSEQPSGQSSVQAVTSDIRDIIGQLQPPQGMVE
jgi:hypothetical protein